MTGRSWILEMNACENRSVMRSKWSMMALSVWAVLKRLP